MLFIWRAVRPLVLADFRAVCCCVPVLFFISPMKPLREPARMRALRFGGSDLGHWSVENAGDVETVVWRMLLERCFVLRRSCCGSAVDGAIGGRTYLRLCGGYHFGSPQQLLLICFEAAIGAAMWACGMLLAIRDRGKKFIRLWSIF